jgi:hypothetical protein
MLRVQSLAAAGAIPRLVELMRDAELPRSGSLRGRRRSQGVADFTCQALIALGNSSAEILAAVEEAGFTLVHRPDGSIEIINVQLQRG